MVGRGIRSRRLALSEVTGNAILCSFARSPFAPTLGVGKRLNGTPR